MMDALPFIDLGAQRRRIETELLARIQHVVADGKYIMGPEVKELEQKLADYCGSDHCISCGNGTDALQLALMALEIGPGDAVFTPSFTFAATAEVVPLTGAIPVFVDIELERYTMDPASLERSIDTASGNGFTPKAIIPVDLFGRLANYAEIERIAEFHNLKIIADAAQGFGARDGQRTAGAVGDLATTSFFPAKPLGCYGDGGAIFTNDGDIADRLRSLRVHGKGKDKYDNVRIGLNSRLDTLQAAILLEKLAIYDDEIERRQAAAARYAQSLDNLVTVPRPSPDERPVWAQYTIRLPADVDRDAIKAKLGEEGVPTMVYYPVPLHRQSGYRGFPTDPEGLLNSNTAAQSVLSLPMHPYLDELSQARVIGALIKALS